MYSREFSHRIKSISMAKFTAAEVAALQAGGNEVKSKRRIVAVQVFLLFHVELSLSSMGK